MFKMSKMRKHYFIRLIGRIAVFVICLAMCFVDQSYDILEGMNFFNKFSILHILWLIWMYDMILQIIPIKNKIALGSQKLFAKRLRLDETKTLTPTVTKKTNKAALIVFIIWSLLITIIGILYYLDIINKIWLFMITVLFYVCDLICVLIWCPFRLILKNKCCTTCRIFNWDHLMMFSPIIFVGGFYSISLVVMSIIAFIVWEIFLKIHPERFYEITNISLRCSECTDKLCTQYCQKRK